MDVNNDGFKALEEFETAVRFPSVPNEQVIRILPITQVFSGAMLEAIGIDRRRQFGHLAQVPRPPAPTPN